MLNILITFDYELFLGKNYLSEEEVLFVPTNQILDALDSCNVKGTFFADVCSVFQHKKYNQDEYCNGFSEQLKQMAIRGHDVQLHIHSNWLKSDYNASGWNISFKGYKIHEFGFESGNLDSVQNIIRKGKEYLETTIRDVKKEYKCIAYRAGGFCIRPEEELSRVLVENGIIIDSSVALKQKSIASIQDYDFSHSPNNSDWWFNSKKGLLTPVSKDAGDLYEVAIGYGKNSIWKFIGIPISELHVKCRHGAGTGIEIPGYNPSNLLKIYNKVKRRLFSYGILSLDSRGYRVLVKDLEYLYKKWNCNKEDHYVSIICHPKLASTYTIDNMCKMINEIKQKSKEYSFITMDQVARMI